MSATSTASRNRTRAWLDRVMPAARIPLIVLLWAGQSNNRTGNSSDIATDPITFTDAWTLDKDDPANETDFVALSYDHGQTSTGGTHAHGPGSPAGGFIKRIEELIASEDVTQHKILTKMLAVSGSKMLDAASGPDFHWEVDVNTYDSLALSDNPALPDGVRHLHMPQVEAAIELRPDVKEAHRVMLWWQGENEHGQMSAMGSVSPGAYATALGKTFDYYRDNWGVDLFGIFRLQPIGADALARTANSVQLGFVRQAHDAVVAARSDCIEVFDGDVDLADMFDATHPTHDIKVTIGRAAAEAVLEELGLYTPA